MKKHSYYKYLDIMRIFSCIMILLYHLNILKGGYLAVCSFFTLSGYLSCISAFKKEKFSLLEYYKNRFLKIYLPLIIVVFISVTVISFFDSINWINLKPEVTSVLGGYNNFWQLDVNLDYFARHIDSPFMHLWYISILLQFELVFPFIFMLLKKLADKIYKIVPILIISVLSLVSIIFFYKLSTDNIMGAYYNTFARSFSYLLGMGLGFIHVYYKNLIPKSIKDSHCAKLIFFLYLTILMDIILPSYASSKYFALGMIATTFITLRIIEYSTIIFDNHSADEKIVKSLSATTYEIYLVQYPVIFLFQYINVPEYLKIIFIIGITLVVASIIYFALNRSKRYKIVRIILTIILFGISSFGAYKYVITKDYTKDLKALEEQLAQNEQMMNEKQEAYELNYQQEQEKLQKALDEIEDDATKLTDVIHKLPIVGVGDSVMLGAITNLYEEFPNGYVDAQISRTAWVINSILKDLKNKNKLGNPIIINVGANGDCPDYCRADIMKTLEDRTVFWLNVTNDNDVHVNKTLSDFANNYDNLYVIDWNSISKGHPEYFVADGIHLTEIGRQAYTKTIYDTIYNHYLEQYNIKKEEIIKEHENKVKNKISFYGNKLLLNVADLLQEDFKNDKFIIDKDLNFKKLKEELDLALKSNTITNKIVFVFDDEIVLTKEEYIELIEMCSKQQIYIVIFDKQNSDNISTLKYENVTLIDFYSELKNNSNYLMVDKKHLTFDGNKKLNEMIKKVLK